MKKLRYYSLLGLLMLGCQRAPEELPIPQGKGALQMTLRIDAGLASGASKAPVQDTYPITAAELKVAVAKQDGTTVGTWDPMTTLPPVVYLEPGNYTLTVATAGDRSSVAEKPLYQGQSTFQIVADKVTQTEVVCAIRSMAVSLTLADGVAVLTERKITYYALDKPENTLFATDQDAKRVYLDAPFPYGVKIEGRIKGIPWGKNVLVYENLTVGTYHNLILSDQ